jgi:hypothetical protein
MLGDEMTISRVQGNSTHNGGGTNSSISLTLSPIGSGNAVLIWFYSNTTLAATPITDDKGNTYNNAATATAQTYSGVVSNAYWLTNVTNGPSTFTLNFSASVGNYSSLSVEEFSGIGTASDGNTGCVAANYPGNYLSGPGSSITTTVAGDLIWMGDASPFGSLGTVTAGTQISFTMGINDNSNQMYSEWGVQSSAGSINPTMSVTSNNTTFSFVVALEAAASFVPYDPLLQLAPILAQ